jgi:hypothetical protein
MQNWFKNKVVLVSLVFLVILSVTFLFARHSRNSSENITKEQSDSKINQLTGSDNYPSNINFRSFQNADSTWGFTVFVNTKPYLHHKKIPLNKANSGFKSKSDAEKVARLFTKMIQNGDLNPALNKYSLDSLDISMN